MFCSAFLIISVTQMVEGQGWEGMYFLDEKMQFLCKNRKTYLQK